MENQNQNQNENENACYCNNPICNSNPVLIDNEMEAFICKTAYELLKKNKDRKKINEFKKDFRFYKSKDTFYTDKETETIINSRLLQKDNQMILYADRINSEKFKEVNKIGRYADCEFKEEEECGGGKCCKNYKKHYEEFKNRLDNNPYEIFVNKNEKKKILRDIKENKSCKNISKWDNIIHKREYLEITDMLQVCVSIMTKTLCNSQSWTQHTCIRKLLLRTLAECSVSAEDLDRNGGDANYRIKDLTYEFNDKDIIKQL
jgi:hypothetical protein